MSILIPCQTDLQFSKIEPSSYSNQSEKGLGMKQGKWLTSAVLFGLLFLSCSDDKDDSNPTGPGANIKNGTLTATISGDFTLNFQSNAAYGLQATANATQGITGMMHIQGAMSQGADAYLIDIQIYHDPATGTYSLAFPPVDAVGTVTKNNSGSFSKSGSVTLTTVSSTRMKGTFSFTAFRMTGVGQEVTTTVSSGVFDVPVIASEN